jgi:hypothetical protein
MSRLTAGNQTVRGIRHTKDWQDPGFEGTNGTFNGYEPFLAPFRCDKWRKSIYETEKINQ